MGKFSTRRVIQLSCIEDDHSSRASICFRAAANAERIGNKAAAKYFRVRGARFQVSAAHAARLLERFA